MFKFFRRLILSLVIILFLLFAGVTYAGYYYLDAIATRLIGPKITEPVKKRVKAPPRPMADEAAVDSDEAALLDDLYKEEEPAAAAPPRESQVDLLDYYDFILETKSHTSVKPLCEVLCDRTRFSPGRDDLALQNIKDFFMRETKSSSAEKPFNDAAFRIALINLSLTTDLFPKPIREIILDIEKVETMTSWQKLMFVFNAEIEIAKFVVFVKSHQKENRGLKKQLEEIHKLQKQCSSKNKAATLELCTALNTANW